MPQNTHLETISADAERLPEPVHGSRNPQVIHEGAAELARTLTWLPNSSFVAHICRAQPCSGA